MNLPPASPPSRQRRKQARPQELLEAALALFVEKGFAATKAEEVAARAGVSKGTLYLYFASKEDLFKALVRECLSGHIAEGAAMIAGFQGSASELLAHVIDDWWTRIGQTPAGGISKIMVAEARNFPELASFFVDEVINPTHELLGQVIQRGIDRGEFRPVPVAETIQVLIGPVLQLVLNEHSLGACALYGPVVEPRAVIRTHIDLILHGLYPRPAPSTQN